MTRTPLLALTMIVKDEAHTLERTLASVAPHVDRYCILDTGSTDGTQELVRRVMSSVEGEVHEGPFVDYAHARNRTLDLCGASSQFVLSLDADDVLVGGDALRSFLEAERDRAAHEAFYLRVELGGVSLDSTRVARTRAGWRWVGSLHEVLMHPDRPPPSRRIPDVVIRHLPMPRGRERSRARWEHDVEQLEEELRKNPSASRAAFCLGMTYSWLQRWEEAIAAFDRRIALGGWVEELFYAKLARARAAKSAGRAWSELLPLYLDAHATAPHRAEPLYDIAMHHDAQGEHALAYLFARRGHELRVPADDRLFVEDEIYAWRMADLVGSHAYWIGEFEVGEAAARKASEARPDDERLRANLGFYEKRRAHPQG